MKFQFRQRLIGKNSYGMVLWMLNLSTFMSLHTVPLFQRNSLKFMTIICKYLYIQAYK